MPGFKKLQLCVKELIKVRTKSFEYWYKQEHVVVSRRKIGKLLKNKQKAQVSFYYKQNCYLLDKKE